MRLKLAATLATILLAAITRPVRADVTYDLALQAYFPSALGSGTLTLNSAPSPDAITDFVTAAYASGYPNLLFPYRIESMEVAFLGHAFTLDVQNSAADAYFQNGDLYILNANLSNATGFLAFGNDSFGGIGGPGTFEFYTDADGMYAGNTTATLATPTPEPTTLALLSTGLLGLFLTRRAFA